MTTRRKRDPVAQERLDAHKLSVPRSADAVPRAALLERVFGQRRARIVILQAPAGHGKTTTLSQIESRCQTEGTKTGWISLDEGDNDSKRFSAHLYSLVSRLWGEAPSGAQGSTAYRSDWLISELARGQEPVALFFDDFQSLTDPAILTFCRDFLVRAPANLRLFIGARTLPEVGLGRLIVGGHALVLRADDLRFSTDEVAQFFRQAARPSLSPGELNAIVRRTEGWPAAVQLFRLSLENPAKESPPQPLDRHTPREMADYLADAVLSAQPEPRRTFLLETSLLGRLTAPLCEEITGRRDAQSLLVAMEHGGLFLRALDPELRWFRYHPLFSSFLADHLRDTRPERINRIHQTAAAWFHARGYFEDALHHAIACGNFELAAEVLDEWASILIADGHMSTVERWLERLPLEVIEQRPGLVLKAAWAMVFPRRRKGLDRYLGLLQRQGSESHDRAEARDILLSVISLCSDDISEANARIARLKPSDEASNDFSHFEQAALSNTLAYRSIILGAFDEAAQHLVRARAHNVRADTSFAGGYTACFEGIGLMLQGRLGQANVRFQRGLDGQRAVLDKTFVSAALASCAIWSLYESNDLDAVEAIFEEFGDAMLECILPDFLPLGHMPAARTAIARGRDDEGHAILDRAEKIAIARRWPRIARLFDWERARLALLDGELSRARKLAVRAAADRGPSMPDAWTPVAEDIESTRFGEIRLAIASGRLDLATQMLEAEQTLERSRLYRHLRLNVLHALLMERRGLRVPAQRRMTRTLEAAAAHGHIRIFLDEGPDALGLLSSVIQKDPGAGKPGSALLHGLKLIDVAGFMPHTQPAARTADPELQLLTKREREIFGLLSLRLSNNEIAERSFVSENTVKYHLKNIFAKLGITTRSEAYAVGHRLGLSS